ncbi:hypothetical protein [Haloprofundus halobius]|uniref:hypothetical protein n=1 Tax=Haloprofundus halobius TaxID=2876194 RepID=UPI001CCE2F4D|nr:hypothetical protein [Haloprofundus halobius]
MSTDGIFLFNPLPWERELSGPIADQVVNPRGVPNDETSGRHFQDRDNHRLAPSGFVDDEDIESMFSPGGYYLPSTAVPGYGWTVVPRDELISIEGSSFDERSTVETDRYVLTFDRDSGGIASWYDKDRNCEWVDHSSEYPLAGFVHEEVVDNETDRPRKRLFDYRPEVEDRHAAVAGILDAPRGFRPDWHGARSGPDRVLQHRVFDGPERYEVRQILETPQVESNVVLQFSIPTDGDTITVDAQWDMGLRTQPEATYLAFPFDLDDPTPRLDVGGQAMEPGEDQLPGSVYDYYTVQYWADLSDTDRGMTIGCPLNPLVQLGDFNFAENQWEFDLEHPLFLGWVTNNYWDTNFRAHQPGRVRAQYHLTPHDEFDEALAHKSGLEATHYEPLAQTLGEGTMDEPPIEGSGRFLNLPELPVLVTQIRPVDADTGVFHPGIETVDDRDDRILVSLRNASDDGRTAQIGHGELVIDDAARTDPTGKITKENLRVTENGVDVRMEARETVTVRLDAGLNE